MANVDVTRIAGNIGALNSLNSLANINNQLAIHQTRLATGKKINEAADDPSGMSLATTFDIRRQGLKTVLNGIGDAKNLLSTAEGGLKKVQDILIKMKNKALEAQSGTIGVKERDAIAAQLNDYRSEIDAIVSQTQWNSSALLGASGSAGGSAASQSFLTSNDGTYTTSFSFTGSQGFAAVGSSATTGLGLNSSYTNANVNTTTAVDTIQSAIDKVKIGISDVGSFTARLTFKEDALAIQYTNTESAYNRIMNANMAEEQVEASKYMILQQTATAMLAQANSAPQFLLSLFR